MRQHVKEPLGNGKGKTMSWHKRMSLAQARVWNMRVGLPHVCTSRSLSYAIMRTKSKGRAGYLFVATVDWYRPKGSALLSRGRCFQRVHAPVSHYRDCLLKFYFQKRLISSRVFTHVLIDDTAMSEHLWMHPLQGICYSWYSLASEDTRTRSKLTLFLNYFSKQLIRYSTGSAMYKSKYMYT